MLLLFFVFFSQSSLYHHCCCCFVCCYVVCDLTLFIALRRFSQLARNWGLRAFVCIGGNFGGLLRCGVGASSAYTTVFLFLSLSRTKFSNRCCQFSGLVARNRSCCCWFIKGEFYKVSVWWRRLTADFFSSPPCLPLFSWSFIFLLHFSSFRFHISKQLVVVVLRLVSLTVRRWIQLTCCSPVWVWVWGLVKLLVE